ncbi:MAG: VanZ family protein [Clostridiales bacterium]|nr:VanZ family protein [Clostridiales bacterium]
MRNLMYMLIDLLSGAIVALPLAWLFLRLCGNRGGKRFLLYSLFILYLCKMFDVVGIPALQYVRWDPNISLIPLTDEKNLRFFLQLGLNAAMFAPFGFLLPVLWRKCRKWNVTVLSGFLLSLFIELIQLFSSRATDVDDLLMNTLGAGFGYFAAWIFFHKKWALDPAPGTSKVGDILSLTVSILIPLLTIVLVRTPISDCIYRLPLFD